MQHFLQVESTGPASSGHISEIPPPTRGRRQLLARGRGEEVGGGGREGGEETGREAPVTLKPGLWACGKQRARLCWRGLGAGQAWGPEMEGKEEGGRPAAAQRCLSRRVTSCRSSGPGAAWGQS